MKRFILAQEKTYQTAFMELQNGKKVSHWMWFIFPQIRGLGRSEMARKYAIENKKEAVEFLQHEILSERLLKITEILVENVQNKTADQIFGYPDNLKFHSSLTLFAWIAGNYRDLFSEEKFSVFDKALQKYFDGKSDFATVKILKEE